MRRFTLHAHKLTARAVPVSQASYALRARQCRDADSPAGGGAQRTERVMGESLDTTWLPSPTVSPSGQTLAAPCSHPSRPIGARHRSRKWNFDLNHPVVTLRSAGDSGQGNRQLSARAQRGARERPRCCNHCDLSARSVEVIAYFGERDRRCGGTLARWSWWASYYPTH